MRTCVATAAIVMVIATIKAAFVAFFFMHLAWDKPFNILLFLGSFVFVGLFIIFTLGDARLTSPAFIYKTDEVLPADAGGAAGGDAAAVDGDAMAAGGETP